MSNSIRFTLTDAGRLALRTARDNQIALNFTHFIYTATVPKSR